MKPEEFTDKAIEYILDELADERKLTAWEKSFVESISDQWNRVHRLSERQKEILGEIWEKL